MSLILSLILIKWNFAGFISPLCLPMGNYESVDQNLTNKTGIVAGWGVSTLGLLG